MIVLQPCPCCNGMAKVQGKSFSDKITESFIQCRECGLRTDSYNIVKGEPSSAFWEALASKWNRRDGVVW